MAVNGHKRNGHRPKRGRPSGPKDIADRILLRKKQRHLQAYAECGNLHTSAAEAKISRTTHYDWLDADPEYAKAFKAAGEMAIEALEAEARRRAVDGYTDPVYQGGKKVGAIRRYSDVLLIFLLKGAAPGKYRDALMRHTGPGGGPIQHAHAHLLIDPQKLTDDELETFERARDRLSAMNAAS